MATSGLTACPHCDAELPRTARFCVSCGTPIHEDSGAGTDSAGTRAAIQVAALQYLGTFAVILVVGRLVEPSERISTVALSSLVLSGGLLVLGLLGAWRLRDFEACLAGPTTPARIALGAASGPPLLALNLLVIRGLGALLGDSPAVLEFGIPDDFLILLFAVAVLPALFEEWVCRGVLWAALRRITGPRMTILLTAGLFGLLHGLNGAGFLEAPTRFVMGLALGWLRLRTGSLWPPVALHFVNNALALLIV